MISPPNFREFPLLYLLESQILLSQNLMPLFVLLYGSTGKAALWNSIPQGSSGSITLVQVGLFCDRGWLKMMKAIYTVMFTLYKRFKLQSLKIRDLNTICFVLGVEIIHRWHKTLVCPDMYFAEIAGSGKHFIERHFSEGRIVFNGMCPSARGDATGCSGEETSRPRIHHRQRLQHAALRSTVKRAGARRGHPAQHHPLAVTKLGNNCRWLTRCVHWPLFFKESQTGHLQTEAPPAISDVWRALTLSQHQVLSTYLEAGCQYFKTPMLFQKQNKRKVFNFWMFFSASDSPMFLTEGNFIICPSPMSSLRCEAPSSAPPLWAAPGIQASSPPQAYRMPCSQGYAEFLHVFIMHS